jgi:hypothetical protein
MEQYRPPMRLLPNGLSSNPHWSEDPESSEHACAYPSIASTERWERAS